MSVDLYRDKYIKYKGKYLSLKNAQGGVLNPSDLGEHWFLVPQEGVDLLCSLSIINQKLGQPANEAPKLDKILKLLGKTVNVSYSIRLGDSTLKNLSNNKTTDRTLTNNFRFGFTKSPEDMKKLSLTELTKFKATTFYKMREDAVKSGQPNVYLSDAQITSHLQDLMSQNGISQYIIVHIDVNKNKNTYLSAPSFSKPLEKINIIEQCSQSKKISLDNK